MGEYEKEVVIVTTAVQRTTVATKATAPPPPSVRDIAIGAIVQEAGCTTELAATTLTWIESFVDNARNSGYSTQFPSTRQLRSPEYSVFEQVVSHGTSATPGSAHSAIEAALLDPTRDEFGLRHEMREDTSQSFCTVRVSMGVLR